MMREKRVYFARCLGPKGEPIGAIKIGCSYGHEDRLVSIGRNLPFSLKLIARVPGHLVLETACHLYLRNHRIDGEYFHDNEVVQKFVAGAQARCAAFPQFTADPCDEVHPMAMEGFMSFHGVSLEEVCKFLSIPLKRHEGKISGKYNGKLVAATGLLAQARNQHPHWPRDAISGMAGKRHYSVTAPMEAETAA